MAYTRICTARVVSTGRPCTAPAQPNSEYCGKHRNYASQLQPAALPVSNPGMLEAPAINSNLAANIGHGHQPASKAVNEGAGVGGLGMKIDTLDNMKATDGGPQQKRPEETPIQPINLDELSKRGLVEASMRFYLEACQPFMLWGPPGIGKTSMLRSYAEERGWKFVHIDASGLTMASEIAGLPVPEATEAGTQVVQAPKDFLRELALDRMREEQGLDVTPTLLFFDEFTATTPEVQNAVTRTLYDRKAGDVDLPTTTRVCAAGNRASQSIHAESGLSEHMSNRLRHLDLPDLSPEEWASGELNGWGKELPSERKAWWITVVQNFAESHSSDAGGANFWDSSGEAYKAAVEHASETGGSGFGTPRSYSSVCDMLAKFDESRESGNFIGDPSPFWAQEMSAALGEKAGQALFVHAKTLAQNLPDVKDWLSDNTQAKMLHKEGKPDNEATIAMLTQLNHAAKMAATKLCDTNITEKTRQSLKQEAHNYLSSIMCLGNIYLDAENNASTSLIKSVVVGKMTELMSSNGHALGTAVQVYQSGSGAKDPGLINKIMNSPQIQTFMKTLQRHGELDDHLKTSVSK